MCQGELHRPMGNQCNLRLKISRSTGATTKLGRQTANTAKKLPT